MDDHRIEFKPGIPTEPGELRKWLQEWHKEHNTTMPEGQRPGYKLTDQGRQLLGLAIGGNS